MGALYTRKWSQRLTTEIEGFEIPVELPDMPRKAEMINFDKPRLQQKFERTVIPADLRQWPKEKERKFVAEEWHKRIHGVWILIKGEPVYLPGTAYVFFNYWETEGGGKPIFRMEAVQYFQINAMAERHPNCFGLFDVKCRRLGDTEKELFIGWEFSTRVRKSWFGMQNITEEDAWENFQRVVMANRSMIYFFKPRMSHGDMPQGAIEFRFKSAPASAQNDAVDTLQDPNALELKSRIDYRATKLKMYDGKRLRRYHLDEPGKISPAVMHIGKQWSIVKLCLSRYNGKVIVGKAGLTTTIEDHDNGATVEVLQELWDESNPTQLNANGRTASGLWRVFRGYLLAADVDEWGHHDVAEAKRLRDNEIAELQRLGKFDQITALKRRMPANIDEALVPPANDCILGAFLIDEQIAATEKRLEAGEVWTNRPYTGDFIWSNGFGSDVLWAPHPSGRCEVSGHPPRPNAREIRSGISSPSNTDVFAAGADPIDHLMPRNDASDGAVAVGAIYDPQRETFTPAIDEHGTVTNLDEMVTNRCCCTYRHRPTNPYDFYEDVLKILIYYGCKINVENNKAGLVAWIAQVGYGAYLSKKPVVLDAAAMLQGKRRRGEQGNYGTAATPDNIASYVEAIINHNMTHIKGHTHLALLKDMRKFNGEKKNRTKRDLSVAWGHALTLMRGQSYIIEKRGRKERWRKFPLRTFEYGAPN